MSVAMPVDSRQPPFEPLHPTQTASGRLRQDGLDSASRNFAMFMHLGPLLAFFVLGPFAIAVPLILWLTRKDNSAFEDDHGREAVNMSITGLIVFVAGVIISGIAWIPVLGWGIGGLGWLIGTAWYITALVNTIRGSIAANSGEFFRYPIIIRFIS